MSPVVALICTVSATYFTLVLNALSLFRAPSDCSCRGCNYFLFCSASFSVPLLLATLYDTPLTTKWLSKHCSNRTLRDERISFYGPSDFQAQTAETIWIESSTSGNDGHLRRFGDIVFFNTHVATQLSPKTKYFGLTARQSESSACENSLQNVCRDE